MDKETDFIPTHFNLKFLAKFGDTTTYLIEEAKPKESGSSNLQLLDDESEQDEEMEEIVGHNPRTLHNLFFDGDIEMTTVPKEGVRAKGPILSQANRRSQADPRKSSVVRVGREKRRKRKKGTVKFNEDN
ncbi:hypothetical protein FF1_034951 [Malus domestica]